MRVVAPFGAQPLTIAATHAGHAHTHPTATATHRAFIERLAQRDAVSAAGPRRPKALLLDAAGTFLIPSESVSDVYLRYARPHGVTAEPRDVLAGFRLAYNDPWGPQRYVGAARDFWRRVVFSALGTDNEAVFRDIYAYYARPEAWRIPPGARDALTRVRAAGVRIGIVSNFDSRLRPLLAALDLSRLFDAVIVSAEVGAEKPSPRIFDAACDALRVDPTRDFVLHVGDDRRNDVWGARACGIEAWLWGEDVESYEEIADRIVTGHTALCGAADDPGAVLGGRARQDAVL